MDASNKLEIKYVQNVKLTIIYLTIIVVYQANIIIQELIVIQLQLQIVLKVKTTQHVINVQPIISYIPIILYVVKVDIFLLMDNANNIM